MFEKGGIGNPIWVRTVDNDDDNSPSSPQEFWGVQFCFLTSIVGVSGTLAFRLPVILIVLIPALSMLGAVMLPASVTRAVCVLIYVVIGMFCVTCIAQS